VADIFTKEGAKKEEYWSRGHHVRWGKSPCIPLQQRLKLNFDSRISAKRLYRAKRLSVAICHLQRLLASYTICDFITKYKNGGGRIMT